MDIFYASHYGHTERIARALAEGLLEAGMPVALVNLAAAAPEAERLRGPEPCVLISAVRYGRHLAPATRLLHRLAPLTPEKPLVLLSVSLTARKPGRTAPAGNAYLRKWIARSGARPRHAEAIAGKLEYPRYGPLDRSMIRLIMRLSGGPADGISVVDFTPWQRVAALAREIPTMI